jgi:anti-sigma B factor antagonist
MTVVTCSGRLVDGAESSALQQHLNDLISENPSIVLHLGEIEFIDSSGLGLLVRFLNRARNARGHLSVCAVSPKIRDVLNITRLNRVFEPYESEAAAIDGFYGRGKRDAASPRPLTILCVVKSADVLAYVRELLRHSGYHVVASDNLPDAVTLLSATRPNAVVTTAELRAASGTRAAESFNRQVNALSVIELPADFSTHDAGDAGEALLNQVRTILGGAGGGTPVA